MKPVRIYQIATFESPLAWWLVCKQFSNDLFNAASSPRGTIAIMHDVHRQTWRITYDFPNGIQMMHHIVNDISIVFHTFDSSYAILTAERQHISSDATDKSRTWRSHAYNRRNLARVVATHYNICRCLCKHTNTKQTTQSSSKEVLKQYRGHRLQNRVPDEQAFIARPLLIDIEAQAKNVHIPKTMTKSTSESEKTAPNRPGAMTLAILSKRDQSSNRQCL
jgi:hypothetical protein